MILTSQLFSGSAVLQRVANGNMIFARGDRGLGVQLIQGGLFCLGYALPNSIKAATLLPDGRFGFETSAAVQQFQSDNGLTADRVVGPDTLSLLDSLLPGLPTSRKFRQKVTRFSTGTATSFGSLNVDQITADAVTFGQDDPAIDHDDGGVWNSVPTQLSTRIDYAILLSVMVDNGVLIAAVAPHALGRMMAYLGNSGSTLLIPVDDVFSKSDFAKRQLRLWVGAFQDFIERQADGVYPVVSIDTGFRNANDSVDWHFAMGGYKDWLKGTATVDSTADKTYRLDFQYFMYDDYNWNPEKETPPFIPESMSDAKMREYHLEGLAQNFAQQGFVFRTITWNAGERLIFDRALFG